MTRPCRWPKVCSRRTRELRVAAQAAQEVGRATAEMNAETERRSHLANLDQDNRDLQTALLAWRALPNGVRDYARAVEEATVSSRAAAMARDTGRGDDPAVIEAISAKLRQRLDLERQIKEEQDKQALAARIRDTATGGLAGYNRELELAAKLLAEGRISQEEFSAAASRISVEGFEAYKRAVKDGNTELAAAIKAQIEAQAKIAWGAMQAKAALNDVISRALDAMISLTQAGSQAGGILGWVAGMANGVLTRARQAQGEPETVPSWDEYWKGVQGQWSSWNTGHGGSGGSKKESEFDKESKRLKDQVRDMQLQSETLGLSSEAAARLTAQRRLLTAADQDGRKVTAQLTAEIDKQADSYAKASEAQRQAQIAQRQRESLAGNTVSLVGSTARPAEARNRELADLSRMGQLIQGGDPTMLDKLAESGYSVADALEAIRRRTLELQNPGLSGFLDGFKTGFRELATTIVKGGAEAGNALQSFLDSLYSLALDKFAFEPLGEAADSLFDDIARGAGLGKSTGATQPANDNRGGGGIGGLLGGLREQPVRRSGQRQRGGGLDLGRHGLDHGGFRPARHRRWRRRRPAGRHRPGGDRHQDGGRPVQPELRLRPHLGDRRGRAAGRRLPVRPGRRVPEHRPGHRRLSRGHRRRHRRFPGLDRHLARLRQRRRLRARLRAALRRRHGGDRPDLLPDGGRPHRADGRGRPRGDHAADHRRPRPGRARRQSERADRAGCT